MVRLRNKHCGTCRNSNKMIHRTRRAATVRSLSLSLAFCITPPRGACTFLIIETYHYAVFILYTRDLNSQVYGMSQEERSIRIIVHQEFIHKGLTIS